MEIMETQIYRKFQKMMDEQQERLASLGAIEEEQDVNFMRAVTLWEEYESRKYVRTWSPVQQYRNIRNLFRRHSLQNQAMEAFGACQPCKGRKLANEIKIAHEETTRDLQELREAFHQARDKIEQLSVTELDIFNGKLQREVFNRANHLLMARFDALYPPSKPTS